MTREHKSASCATTTGLAEFPEQNSFIFCLPHPPSSFLFLLVTEGEFGNYNRLPVSFVLSPLPPRSNRIKDFVCPNSIGHSFASVANAAIKIIARKIHQGLVQAKACQLTKARGRRKKGKTLIFAKMSADE